MSTATRRNFLKTGLFLAGGAGLGWAAIHQASRRRRPDMPHPDLGPLKPVTDPTTGLDLLSLPEGFRYLTMGWAGQAMSDGFAGPQKADGMGVVAENDGLVTLVRNHELRGSSGPIGNPSAAYDNTGGGTTTLLFDSRRERLEASFISLNGTLNNCAGGVTPWGTWLSCEEGPLTPEFLHHGNEARQATWAIENAQRKHGYVFEVNPGGVPDPQPIVPMGQFYHEAVAIDESSGIAYMTEDRAPFAGFYRYLPNSPGKLADGGRLQMMRVKGASVLADHVPLFEPMMVDWVDIAEPDQGHTPGTHDCSGVVQQGIDAGATAFRSLEGCSIEGADLFFTSKNGGRNYAGMIFHYDLDAQTVQAIWEAPGNGGFTGPDNITVSPRGSLMICEDNESSLNRGQQISGMDRQGQVFAFCRFNPEFKGTYLGHDLVRTSLFSEWAGVCFSKDGQWMFANMFRPGFTCAITGPWGRGPV
ncbi:MAG: DUF839 domain-containing protein, partial [Xanthomonadales bacterium]|nr:PhoX family protein [Gammaproteobacteria bacterium]NNE05945.1 DUF839 domain-containing protein [Xanthomonadales bacterium]NNL94463.1 DUF839 domain-containing protein [Xanthomonadales bacterium]